MENLGNKALKSIVVATGVAIGGLTTLGAYAINVGSNFEAGMSKVQAISGATQDELEKLTAKAKEMGAKTKFSATESAEAFQYMAMAGWKTGDMLNGIEGIMNLAAASGEDLASVSDIVTDALTAFGLQAKDSAHFADVLAKASSNSNTNVGLMGETFKYVAPLAGSMKYSIEDTAVAIGLMANAGIKGSQAGTALRSMLTRLVKPPKQTAEALEALNISVQNADGTMKPLSQTMQELREKFANLSESEKASYAASIAGQEAMSGMLAIVNASEDDFNKLTEAINDSNGATQTMANIMNNNLQGATTILKSNMESLGLAIYDKFNKPATKGIQSVTNALSNLTQSINDGELSKSFDKIAESFGKLVEKLAEGLDKYLPSIINFISYVLSNAPMIVGTLAGIGMSIKGLNAGTTAVDMLTKNFSKMSGIITKVPSNLSKVTSGISNFAGGISSGFNLIFSEITPKFTVFMGNIGKIFSSFGGKMSTFLAPVTEAFSSFGGKISSFLAPVKTILDKTILNTALFAQLVKFNIGEAFNQAFPNFSAGLNKITSAFGEVFQGLIGKIGSFVKTFLPIFARAFNIMAIVGLVVAGLGLLQQNFGEQLTEILTMVTERGPQIINNLVNGIVSKLPDLISKGGELLQNLLNAIIANLPTLINGGIQIIGALVTGISQQLPTLIPTAIELIMTIVNSIIANLPIIIEAGLQLLVSFIEGIVNAIPQLIEMLPTIISTICEVLTQELPNIIQAGITILVSLIQGLVDAIPQLVEMLPTIINTIITTLLNNLPLIIDAGIQILIALINGLIEAIPMLIEMLPQIITTIIIVLAQNLPKIIEAGGKIITSLIAGIVALFGKLGETASNIIETIWNTLKELPGKALQWGKDMIQGFIDGIKSMISSIGNAAGEIANKIKNFLHFSRPDEGPLRNYEEWMPDMVQGLSETLKSNAPKLYKASEMLAKQVKEGLDLSKIYEEMQSAINIETQKLSTNISAKTKLQVAKSQPSTVNNDNGTTINNTQNFYSKETTPFEQQKQAKQQLRRLVYGL